MTIIKTLFAAAVLALSATYPTTGGAQGNYPERPITLIVPLAPGGVADVMSRMIAEHLQAKWGKPVLVDNRPGAGGNIGMDALAKAAPDGYTIGMGNIASHAINPAVYRERQPFHPIRDFAPVSLVGITPSMLVVNAEKVPATTVPELIAYAKANPGKLNYGSSGVGTSLHLGMELFLQKSGTQMVHVPFRGSAPMLTALIGGQVDLAMDAASTSLQHVQSGKLRALAITTPERAFFAPELVPLKEFLPGVEITAWHGIMAPANTPRPIIEKLSGEIQAYLRSPAAEEKLRQQGVIRVGNTPEEFGKVMVEELARFKPIVEQANIQVGN
jgi:tripartite-type tricarboxylate transporter receptor subunit TctC